MYPNIAAELARRGMSRQTLAGRLGVSRKTLHNWEAGENIPPAALEKMSVIFSCPAAYLASREALSTWSVTENKSKICDNCPDAHMESEKTDRKELK